MALFLKSYKQMFTLYITKATLYNISFIKVNELL